MRQNNSHSESAIPFSIVVPVYNDWAPLEACLESLARQTNSPEFEVVIVDDGSGSEAPPSIHQFDRRFPLSILRQSHAGIAAARNRGIQSAKGAILLFTDADCRLDSKCLSVLDDNIDGSPEHSYFQLRIAGDQSSLAGRAEELRLLAIQEKLLREDRCIRYLNTSGFALRRSAINPNANLFDPTALRSEDTLLLTNLIEKGEFPLFVSDAVVRHTLQMSLAQCIRKDMRVAWVEASTFQRIAAKGVRVRMTNRERITMLRSMWNRSRHPSIGRSAWFILAARQALQRAISLVHRCLPLRSPVRPGVDSG